MARRGVPIAGEDTSGSGFTTHRRSMLMGMITFTAAMTVVEEMHLIHVNTGCVGGGTGIDWFAYFNREDVTAEVRAFLPTQPQRFADMHAILAMPNGPEIRPSSHCFLPYQCEFWDRRTANKPPDWMIHIPRLSETAFAELDADGVGSKRDILRNFRSPQHSSASSMPCSQVGN